jgi:hypothetical protein
MSDSGPNVAAPRPWPLILAPAAPRRPRCDRHIVVTLIAAGSFSLSVGLDAAGRKVASAPANPYGNRDGHTS